MLISSQNSFTSSSKPGHFILKQKLLTATTQREPHCCRPLTCHLAAPLPLIMKQHARLVAEWPTPPPRVVSMQVKWPFVSRNLQQTQIPRLCSLPVCVWLQNWGGAWALTLHFEYLPAAAELPSIIALPLPSLVRLPPFIFIKPALTSLPSPGSPFCLSSSSLPPSST